MGRPHSTASVWPSSAPLCLLIAIACLGRPAAAVGQDRTRWGAQFGITVGGGIGSMKGQIVKTTDGYRQTGFNPQTQLAILTPTHEVETTRASDELAKYFPLIKVEVVGGLILTNALKVKVAYGMNFPAYSGRIALVYLLGG